MADGPLSSGYDLVGAYNWDTSTSTATEFITTGAGANTAQELVASLSRDVDLIEVQYGNGANSTMHDYGLNIAIGAAASEQIVIPDILAHGKSTSSFSRQGMYLPFHLPSGQRISYIVDSDGATRGVAVGYRFWAKRPGGKVGYKNAFSEGYNSRAGITIDPGGTANTKGSWTEITASTSQAMKSVLICMTINSNANSGACVGLVDLAVGAASSEQVVIENMCYRGTTGEPVLPSLLYDIEIPSGTRIAVRSQCSITDSQDRKMSVSLVGFN